MSMQPPQPGPSEPGRENPEQEAPGQTQEAPTAPDEADQPVEPDLMSPTSYTPQQKQYLQATARTTLLTLELGNTLPSQWQRTLPLAAQLAQAERAQAHTLTTDHFGDAAVTDAAAAVAKDDLALAQQAQALSEVTSLDRWDSDLDSLGASSTTDVDTLRSSLSLPT